MIRRSLLSVLATVGLLAGTLALATPASAAPLERCRTLPTSYDGVTLQSCIYVDGSNGRATATVTWNDAAPDELIHVEVVIQRSGTSQRNASCAWVYNTHGQESCTAYLPNPPGAQAWRSDAEVYVGYGDLTPDICRTDLITDS